MGAASILSSGLGVAGGIYSMIQGSKEKRDAQNALENYDRQQLNNAYEGVQVSILGSDLQRQEQSRLASGQVAALQDSGTRGLIGGLGRVERGNQIVNSQIAADLDQQQKQIDFAKAQDRANIRSMQENRENADVAALSSQYQSGKQDMNTGMGNIVMGAGMLGNQLGGLSKVAPTTEGQTTALNSVNPAFQSPIGARYQNQQQVNPGAFNVGGTSMFAQQRMPQVGFGNTAVMYDATGQPIYRR